MLSRFRCAGMKPMERRNTEQTPARQAELTDLISQGIPNDGFYATWERAQEL